MNCNLTETEQFMKFKNGLVKNFLRDLTKRNYRVVDEKGNTVPDEIICSSINTKTRCTGVINGPNGIYQCSKNALSQANYCKIHLKKQFEHPNKPKDLDIEHELFFETETPVSDLKKKFIEDSFYYVDSRFIYTETGERVGIVDNSNYILTDDPFVLGRV